MSKGKKARCKNGHEIIISSDLTSAPCLLCKETLFPVKTNEHSNQTKALCPECESRKPGSMIRIDSDGCCIKCKKQITFGEDLLVGLRHNTGKPRLDLNSLGIEVQKGEAAVWEYGLKKYSLGNWLKGMSWQESAASLCRHLDAFLNGQDLDPETGLPHVDHLICCAKIMSNSFHTRKDLDDRVSVNETLVKDTMPVTLK